MSLYPERFVFGMWICPQLIATFKKMLHDNDINYFETSTANRRGHILFQLWLPFDPAFLCPVDMLPPPKPMLNKNS